jgi:hypothetical protein
MSQESGIDASFNPWMRIQLLLRNVIVQVFIDAFEIDVSIIDANVIDTCTVLCQMLCQWAKNDVLLDKPLFEHQAVDVFGKLKVVSTTLVEASLHIVAELDEFFIDRQARLCGCKDGFEFFK